MRMNMCFVGALAIAGATGMSTAAQRVVIAEEFTATWCGYCPSVAEALYNLQQDRPNDIIGMMIHCGDAYTTTWGNLRENFYNVGGYPTVWLDGWSQKVGSSGSVSGNYTDLNNRLNSCLARDTDVSLEIAGEEVSGNQYRISGQVSLDAGAPADTVRIQLIQCFDALDYPEANEDQFNTVRQAMTSFDVSLSSGQTYDFEHVFTLSGESLASVNDVTYIAIAQDPTSSSPSQVHQALRHEHGELPPANVSVGAGGDFPTIQDALSNVGTGSTITVFPGTYAGPIDFNGRSVNLIAQGGPDVTTIDAGGQDTVIYLMNDESTTIDGFTITGGYNTIGSAMRINGDPTINNCIVRDNTATSNYMILSSGNPVISNSIFCNNDPNNIAVTWTDGGGNVFDDICDDDEPCAGDMSGDGQVNVEDVLTIVDGWGTLYGVNDLLEVLDNYGDPC